MRWWKVARVVNEINRFGSGYHVENKTKDSESKEYSYGYKVVLEIGKEVVEIVCGMPRGFSGDERR